MIRRKNKIGIICAILAAALYAINIPTSKLLLTHIPPTLMAGFLYLGAGFCMVILKLFQKATNTKKRESKLTIKELPFTIGMIFLDIIAPILMLIGLKEVKAANASLLNNFEIVATSLIALLVFNEKISKKVWIGILTITLSCCLLSLEDISTFEFSKGSIYILLATICWGLENNCTRKISHKDPLQIVFLKGIFSGTGSLIIGLCIGEKLVFSHYILFALLLGSVAYGLSIYLYVYAQRRLGAAKTSAYYAISPFIGVLLSLILFQTVPGITFFIALIFMIIGAYLCS